MKSDSLPRSKGWNWLARLVLRLYPRHYRSLMANDLLRLYRDIGALEGRASSWAALWDLLCNALAVRWDTLGLQKRCPQSLPCRPPSPGKSGHKGRIGESMLSDLRFALRSLVGTPLFTAAAILTLALGVGANAAIFSVLNAVVLKPLPYSEPDRLALVWPQKTFNKHMLAYFQQHSEAYQEVTAFSGWSMTLTGEGEPELFSGAQVAHNYFQTLGVAAALGRDFGPADAEPGNTEVVILSYGLWQRRFGGDPAILGKRIQLSLEDRHSFTVVGVMPQGYLPLEGAGTWQAWVPLPRDITPELDSAWYLTALGRLSPQATLEEAGAEVKRLGALLKEGFYPRFDEERIRVAAPMLLYDALVGETIRTRLWVLLGAVGLILLIACANVGNLLLARVASRRKELAVRQALGATAGRLVRLLLLESLLLAAAGALAGLMVCGLLLGLASGHLPDDLPRSDGIRLDWAVLAFALAASLLSALIYCLAPAWKVIRQRQTPELQVRSGLLTREGRRISTGLVGAEIALSVILAAGGVLLIQSFFKLSRVAPGFSSESVLTLSISTPDRWPREEKQSLFRELMPRLSALPHIESVGAIHILPFSLSNWAFPFFPQGHSIAEGESPPLANFRVVMPGYFQTLGIPILSGRDISWADRAGSLEVGLVNQSMARLLWPDEEAVGKEIRLFGPDGKTFQVVGVVGDVKQHGLDRAAAPEMYRPWEQWPMGGTKLTLRTSGEPLDQIENIRQLVRSLSDEVPLSEVRTLDQIVSASISGSRLQAALLGGFALLAVLLAVVGVYGVTAYTERRRSQEFGIRIALGAAKRDVVRQVLRRAMPAILIGEAAGLLAALACARLISGLLFGVEPSDPPAFILVLLATTSAALLACLAPARRAGRIDPVQALRCE